MPFCWVVCQDHPPTPPPPPHCAFLSCDWLQGVSRYRGRLVLMQAAQQLRMQHWCPWQLGRSPCHRSWSHREGGIAVCVLLEWTRKWRIQKEEKIKTIKRDMTNVLLVLPLVKEFSVRFFAPFPDMQLLILQILIVSCHPSNSLKIEYSKLK